MSANDTAATPLKLGQDAIDYVSQYGGRCRDCADMNGICSTGMPCDDAKAIRYVIGAINYGWEHGFLAPPAALSAPAPAEPRIPCYGHGPQGGADAEVERILAMTDEEILAETRAAGEDPKQIAAEMKTMFEHVKARVDAKVAVNLAPAAPRQDEAIILRRDAELLRRGDVIAEIKKLLVDQENGGDFSGWNGPLRHAVTSVSLMAAHDAHPPASAETARVAELEAALKRADSSVWVMAERCAALRQRAERAEAALGAQEVQS